MPTNAITRTGAPVVVPSHDEVTSSVARLDRAVREKNWDAADVELNNLQGLLQRDGGSALTPEEKRSVSLVLANAYKEADKANEWSILEIILAIFALGIPGLVDWWGKDNNHERVHGKLKGFSEKSKFEPGDEGPAAGADADWLARSLAPAGRGAKPTSAIAKTTLAYGPDEAAQNLTIADYKAMPPQDRALVFAQFGKAGAAEQEAFAARLWAGGFDNDDARFLVMLKPSVVGKTVNVAEFNKLDEDAKKLIVRHVCRSEDHQIVRAFVSGMVEDPLTAQLDPDSRALIAETLLDGNTNKQDSYLIVSTLFGVPVSGGSIKGDRAVREDRLDVSVARAALATMSLKRLEHLHDDVEGNSEDAMIRMARRVHDDPATPVELRMKLERTILR